MRRGGFYTGLGLLTGAVLALEILETRLLSVLTWYSLAFLVISMGMFGLTVGALRVYFLPDRYVEECLARRLSSDATAFALLIPVSYVLLLIVPLRVAPVWTTVLLFVCYSAILAFPFVPAGAAIAAALTRAPFPIGRLYAADLLGAALGALAVPGLFRVTGAGSAALAIGCLAALAAVAFASAERGARPSRSSLAVFGLLAALCIANGATDRGLVPIWVKGEPEDRKNIEFEYWNTYSRVVVSPVTRKKASLWGAGRRCQLPIINQRSILIDGEAETALFEAGDNLDSVEFLLCDVTNVVHYLRRNGPVAVIGAGGTRDIQSALLAGHESVTAIEMNDGLVDLIRGPVGRRTGVAGNPAVRLVHDEGRSYLTRTGERFEVIQASLTDTWAATGAGAHALGENGLYTEEAWRIFLERLRPGGMFTVSRWYAPDDVDETARLVSLAVATLLHRNVADPSRHIAVIAADFVATLILSREPLTEQEIDHLERVAHNLGFDLLAAPGRPPSNRLLRRILGSKNAEELERATVLPVLDYRPSTDDRPFFFNMIRLRGFHRVPENTGGIIEGNRMATAALVLAAFSSVLLAVGAVIVPLARWARPRGRGLTLLAGLSYFFLIGLAFLLVEIGLLLRLSVVLGHPSYSLLVVLPALIAATGVGSYLSDRLPVDRSPGCYLFPVIIALFVGASAWALPLTALAVQPLGLWKRVAYGLLFTAVPGFVMGMAFPAGMRLVRGTMDEETPWFWGINGVGSVLAGSLAIMIALEFGISWALRLAALFYLLLLPSVFVLRTRRS